MPLDDINLKKEVGILTKKYYPDNVILEIPEFLDIARLNHEILPTTIFFILNFPNQGYEFVSSNITHLFTVPPERLVNEGLTAGLTMFSGNSKNVFVQKLLPEMFAQFQRAASEGMDLLKFRVQYNINMDSFSKGRIDTLHVMKPALLDQNGMPILALKYIFDISDFSKETDITMTFEYQEKDKMKTFFSNTYPSDGSPVSKREAEIISQIQKGLSSKEIAEKLSISIHTVNTHRKNIMRKYNVNSYQQDFYKKR